MSTGLLVERHLARKDERYAVWLQGKTAFEHFQSTVKPPRYPRWNEADFARGRTNADLAKAEVFILQAIELCRAEGAFADMAVAYRELAEVYHCQGRFADAEDACGHMLDLSDSFPQQDLDDLATVAAAMYHLGMVRARANDHAGARVAYYGAFEIQRALSDRDALAHTLEAMKLTINEIP